MLITTEGIVLKTINYSETSVIAKIYTKELGLRSYMINGVRSVKGRTKSAMLQVLNHLDLVVYERNDKQIHRIKEMKYAQIYTAIPFNVIRTSIALFFSELLYKVLKDESGNTQLFNYISSEIQFLETAEQASLANLPIKIMLGLSEYLGFYPDNTSSTVFNRFDLKEGNFVANLPIKDRIIDVEESLLLSQLLANDFEDWKHILKSRQQRKTIMNILQMYYLWHIENFSHIRSLKVLESIF